MIKTKNYSEKYADKALTLLHEAGGGKLDLGVRDIGVSRAGNWIDFRCGSIGKSLGAWGCHI